ncbi:hypothetical protein ACJX0J_028401, partial [Zea mays]
TVLKISKGEHTTSGAVISLLNQINDMYCLLTLGDRSTAQICNHGQINFMIYCCGTWLNQPILQISVVAYTVHAMFEGGHYKTFPRLIRPIIMRNFMGYHLSNMYALDIDGKDVPLKKFKNKVLLIVNVASQCGLTTANYTELSHIYEKYKTQGFEILAFPCNQFGAQEPGSNTQIKQFACTRFKAEFPIFDKVDSSAGGFLGDLWIRMANTPSLFVYSVYFWTLLLKMNIFFFSIWL